MPSQPIRSLRRDLHVWRNSRHFGGLGGVGEVSGPHFGVVDADQALFGRRSLLGKFRYPYGKRERPVRYAPRGERLAVVLTTTTAPLRRTLRARASAEPAPAG
jgi:hypothetical protein